MISPTHLVSPKDAFDNAHISYEYHKGYKENSLETDKNVLEDALKAADSYEEVLLFLGLTDYVESEGADRENMSLPQNQLDLVNALIHKGKKIILVLFGGSPMELPFEDKVSAILDMYLPGQRGGEATYELLFGLRSPSGKLSETWPISYQDVPYGKEFSKSSIEVYKESIFVGYRYYLSKHVPVRFPFGYGLTYSKFQYSNLSLKEKENEMELHLHLKNVGEYDASEVVEIYVKGPNSSIIKPEKELRAFDKIFLKKGEEKDIVLSLSKESLRYWNIKENRYVLEEGEYDFQVCSDSLTIQLSQKHFLKGEKALTPYSSEISSLYLEHPEEISDEVFEKMSGLKIPALPPKKPITLESRFSDLRSASFLGKILYDAVLSVAKKDRKKALKMPEGAERDNKLKGSLFLKRILESNSLISMSMSAGTSCPYNFAKGFMDLANGHLLKGIKDFCSPVKIPNKAKKED